MSEIDYIITSSPTSIFILYLLISTNFTAELLGCSLQKALNNIYLKHLLGFMTMFVFVVISNNDLEIMNPFKQLLYTMLFYGIFLLTTKMDFKWWIVLIIGLFVIYILQLYKNKKITKNEEKEQFENYQKYLTYFIGGVIFLGVLVYYGKKKAEFKSEFNDFTFFLGKKTACAFNKPFIMNDFKALQYIFK
jgi:chromate transport protein ChrA